MLYRPIIEVSIELGGRSVTAAGLVDSGADTTFVPYEVLAPLGIIFESLPSDGSGGGYQKGRLEPRLLNATISWNGTVLMREFHVGPPGMAGPMSQVVALGRRDFFRLYVVRFNWAKEPPVFDLDPVR